LHSSLSDDLANDVVNLPRSREELRPRARPVAATLKRIRRKRRMRGSHPSSIELDVFDEHAFARGRGPTSLSLRHATPSDQIGLLPVAPPAEQLDVFLLAAGL
jgi:hypothetical protein